MTQCTERIVQYDGLARYSWQCKNKAKYGDKCGVHSPEAVAQRRRKSAERYEATKHLCYACKRPYKAGRYHDRLVEALELALKVADGWSHDQLDGTSKLADALAETAPARALLAEIRAAE